MPQFICQFLRGFLDGEDHVIAGSSMVDFDVSHNLLAEGIWEKIGSPPTQPVRIGTLNSHDGEIEIQKKTTLTVEFLSIDPALNPGPMRLEFGIYDDVKTGLHAEAILKSGILTKVNPQSFPVHSQAIILDDTEFAEESCEVCLDSIDGKYVLHCGGTPKPMHPLCFEKAQSESTPIFGGGIILNPSLCGICRCPTGKPFEMALIPKSASQVVSHVWSTAKILSVCQTDMGRESCQVKMLNPDVRSMALQTAREPSQANRFEQVAKALSLFEEIITRVHTGANLLPKTLANGSVADQQGTLYYHLTSLVPPTGQLTRAKGALELHSRERSPNGTFGFLPSEYNPPNGIFSFLPSEHNPISCDASPKWSIFLRQWIASIQKRYHSKRSEHKLSAFVDRLAVLIEKLIEPLENGPEEMIAGLTLAPFDVDSRDPGCLEVTALWGHWEFMFAGVMHRCDPEISDYLAGRTDDLLYDRNQLYTLIIDLHYMYGLVSEERLQRANDLLDKHGISVAEQ